MKKKELKKEIEKLKVKVEVEIDRLKAKVKSLEEKVFGPTSKETKISIGGVDLGSAKSETVTSVWERIFKDHGEVNLAMDQAVKDSYSHSFTAKIPKFKCGGYIIPTEQEKEIEALKEENDNLRSLYDATLLAKHQNDNARVGMRADNKKLRESLELRNKDYARIEKQVFELQNEKLESNVKKNNILGDLTINELKCILNLIGKSQMNSNFITKTQEDVQFKINELLKRIVIF